jgi:hypothetical protein
MTHDIEHWKRLGFRFEARFPNEYDLWLHSKTLRKLRLYCDGSAWLTDENGEYNKVCVLEAIRKQEQEYADET